MHIFSHSLNDLTFSNIFFSPSSYGWRKSRDFSQASNEWESKEERGIEIREYFLEHFLHSV